MTAPLAVDSRRELTPGALLAQRVAASLLGLWLVIIFTATHVPLPVGALPGNSDKFVHFGAYAVLACLLTGWQLFLRRQARVTTIVIAAICSTALYGIVDEFTQGFVGRTPDVVDWAADTTGSVVGSLAAAAILGRRSV